MKLLLVFNIGRSDCHNFERSIVEAAHKNGMEVHLAYNCTDDTPENVKAFEKSLGVTYHRISFSRSLFDFGNISAYRQLKKLVKSEHFDIIHCNTAIGGIIGRLCAKKVKCPLTIYMTHGLSYNHRSSALKRGFRSFIERRLAKITDAIITINSEDFEAVSAFAPKYKYLIGGVGVNVEKYLNRADSRERIRAELGIPRNATVILSVGDISKRKNHISVIKAMARLGRSDIYYIICGSGNSVKYMKFAVRSGIGENVKFIGYCADIAAYCSASDIGAITSLSEGLGLSGIEMLACGLPLIASDVQGIRGYALDGKTAFVYAPDDIDGIARGIAALADDEQLRFRMKPLCIEKAKEFSYERAVREISDIYAELLPIYFKEELR